MATTYKVLGQLLSNSASLTAIYTAPSSTNTVVSTITVCNQANTSASFRIAVVPSGQSIAGKNYINYDTPVPGNDSIALTLGITLSANDSIQANSSTNTVSFSAFGCEII